MPQKGQTTVILNHAHNDVYDVKDERFGFWDREPIYEEITKLSAGKVFLNYDDVAFGDGMRQFLEEKFPEPSTYEKDLYAAA